MFYIKHPYFFRYVDIAKLLIENGSKVDFREPTDELYPRTMMSDEPLRLALKNRNYVRLTYCKKYIYYSPLKRCYISGYGEVALEP